jgi:hypothetical protein
VAIIWGNNTPIPKDWDKTKNNLSQFQKIGIIIEK